MKVIFHHIPKAAGTSLRCAIEANYDPEQLDHLYFHEDGQLELAWYRAYYRDLGAERQRTVQCFLERLPALIGIVPGPTRGITLLRDPVDRAVSLYHFALSAQFKHVPPVAQVIRDQGLALEQIFSRQGEEYLQPGNPLRPLYQFFNGQCVSLAARYIHWHRIDYREKMTERRQAELLHTAKTLLREHFMVGFTEHYEESLACFARNLGWARQVILRENPTAVRPRAQDVPSEIRRRIALHNQLDIDLYTTFHARWASEPNARSQC